MFKIGDLVKVLCDNFYHTISDNIAVVKSTYGEDSCYPGCYVYNDEIGCRFGKDSMGFSVSNCNLELIGDFGTLTSEEVVEDLNKALEKGESVEQIEDVINPKRYNKGSIEVWDFIIDQDMNFLEGSILKYITRYKDKGGVKDLEKAKVYIDKLIEEFSKKP